MGNLPTCSQGGANAVNDLGQVVGASHFYDPVAKVGRSEAFIVVPRDNSWYGDSDRNGVNDLIVDLGGLQGLENSYVVAHGLNDSGAVVSGSWHAGRDGLGWKRAPFLWQNGVLQSLKSLTGVEFWDVSGINDAGQIIADASGREFYETGRACILLPSR